MSLRKAFGVARNWPAAPGQGGGAPAAPVLAAPTFLPALAGGAARQAVLSPYKLVAAYSGPTMDVYDAEAATTTAIYSVAGGQAPDTSALDPGHTLTVTGLYDQTGNGWRHVSGTAFAQAAPALRLANLVRGKQGISWFDGVSGTTLTGLANAGLPFSTKGSFAYLDVWAPALLGYRQTFGVFGTGSVKATPGAYIQAGLGFPFKQATNYGSTTLYPRNQTGILSLSSGAANASSAMRVDSQKFAYDGGMNAGSDTGSVIGTGVLTPPVPRANGEFFARIVYATPLGDADYAAEQAALNAVFDIQESAANAILFDGDSRVLGYGAFASTEARATRGLNINRQVEPLLSKRCSVTNVGVSGQTLATMNTANGRANVVRQKRAGSSKNILVVTAGINDIAGVAAGSVSGFGSSLHTGQLLPYVQAAQAAGFAAVVGTVYRSGAFTDNAAARNAEVDAYNSAIRSNAAGAGYLVVDYAGLAHGLDPADATYFADMLHQTSRLVLDEAQLLAPVLNGMLA